MKYAKILTIFTIFLILSNCGIYKKTDARKVPIGGKERARKNIEEGRGFSLKGGVDRGTTYQFSSSNPMWRASLEILDFLPLTTVDYSGGIIITDWYNDTSNNDDAIKLTIRFLSNEVQSNSLRIIVHRKRCTTDTNCLVKKIDSKIEEELRRSILTKAAVIKKEQEKEKKKKK
jgi:Domain of unknown function (DUF3576).|tara:strand:+ start:348 stop:869 length:522 start_codon:yes stop_codon:yes gene_type:complete